MSPTFFVTLVVALAAVFYWRVVVMIAIAVLLAFVLMGISTVSSVMTGQKEEHSTVAPAQPGQQRDGAVPGSDEPPGPEGAPPQEQPSPPR
jgi:hypothetical protein